MTMKTFPMLLVDHGSTTKVKITRRQLRRIIREAFIGQGGRVVPGAGLIGEIHMWVDHIAHEPAYRNADAAEVAEAALDHIAGLGLQRDEAYEIALQRAIDMGLPA